NTDVAIDAAAENSARNSKYFKHPLLTWSPALSVGVKQMDDQHIKLIFIANALDEAMESGTGDNVLGMIFSGLVSYTATHFRDEEQLMAAYGYPQLALHKKQHEDLVNQVLDLRRKYSSGKAHLSTDVMDFIKDWIRDHIQGHDKQYGLYLNARGIY
ncbi:MAG: bacteriohemerythrin, partial [Deltaproteobacteria bacterium]